jgi:hypothetical protein
MTDQEMQQYTEEEINKYARERKFPVNNLDSAWMSAEPDYSEVQREYDSYTKFSKIFSLFNSGIRLSKLSESETRLVQYDLITCAELLDMELYRVALSTFFDVATILESCQSKKGFRTMAMNTIIQEIKQNVSDKKKKNVMGGESEE